MRARRWSGNAALPLVAAALAGLAGCRAESRAAPERVESGGLELLASLEPPVPRRGANRLALELREAGGGPVEGARVEVRVGMPAMGAMPAMGGPARVEERGGGRYRAEFSLDMSGSWRVEIEARSPTGARAHALGSLSVGSAGLRLAGAPAEAPPAGPAEAPAAAEGAHERRAVAEHPAQVRVPEGRLQRIGVRTAPVVRRQVARALRAFGRVVPDETSLVDVSLRVGGWVEELRVDAVGDRVVAGEVLFTLYSPELHAAQAEYQAALRSRERARERGEAPGADPLLAAARERLRLAGVAAPELAEIERRGEPLRAVAIRAPASGFAVEKSIAVGSAVEPGVRLYRIAPLERIWVEAEVYESELPLVWVGQAASVTLPNLPGRRFEGSVGWVYPSLAGATRTARLRVELANPELALRPEMFANVELRAERGEGLLVPQSAVLHAGARSFAFVELGAGRFEPREVELGLRSGEEVEVVAGLAEGERVVASGTFLIASESRLRAALEQW
jgi:Cu(I)/Ag(I) efflux system membrane fusion protein